jgi:hypothetical protein
VAENVKLPRKNIPRKVEREVKDGNAITKGKETTALLPDRRLEAHGLQMRGAYLPSVAAMVLLQANIWKLEILILISEVLVVHRYPSNNMVCRPYYVHVLPNRHPLIF